MQKPVRAGGYPDTSRQPAGIAYTVRDIAGVCFHTHPLSLGLSRDAQENILWFPFWMQGGDLQAALWRGVGVLHRLPENTSARLEITKERPRVGGPLKT